MFKFLGIVASLDSRLEYIYASWNISPRLLRVVSADSRISLLEVYIDSDRLHEIQWIILVEWQSKASLRVELWRFSILFDELGIVLAWPKINLRVTALFQTGLGETVGFRHETISRPLNIVANSTNNRISCCRNNGIRPWARISTEKFLVVLIGVKPVHC